MSEEIVIFLRKFKLRGPKNEKPVNDRNQRVTHS